MGIDGRQLPFFDQVIFLHGPDGPDRVAAYWYQLQKRYSSICPFRHSGFPGNGGLDNVSERFSVKSTDLTLVHLFNSSP